ncbi:MAG TPA: hypothetical protein VGK36_06650 [Candidatus Angelobacter sp.]|jgi:hypothetical protein
MATNTQDAGNQMGAGLYLSVRKQIRSWSWRWNNKKLTEVSEREMESPWAGVAEWLRAAHSLLDEQTAEMTRSGDRSRQVPVSE